ncbi:MAG TPA: phosphatase PAP2 family protein, partial [Rugosimonospora sp.]|nr:phosphatase PAP2 family protein [Rugosimonospora sp.]
MVFGVYAVVAGLDWPGRSAAAQRHGRLLFRLEQRLHLDVEPALNDWLAPHRVLRVLANYEYASTYVLSALALIVWLYRRRPDAYRWARNSFVLVNLIGLACFALYPVTPPRLLPDLGFVDTVRTGHTWGSWGSPLVSHANELAAMPSLHIAWAVWVSLVLAAISGGAQPEPGSGAGEHPQRFSAGGLVQVTSAVHVLLTALVIMATANHYLLDAVGGVLLVLLCFGLLGLFQDPPGDRRGARVPASDAFFLHVESAAYPQHVGGLAVLDTSDTPFGRDALARVIQAHLAELPRFRQRLSGRSRWRRPRWVEVAELDWDWHVPARDLTRPDGAPGGMAALRALVAELAGTRLPLDRPLWRFVAVTGVTADRAAAILVVHHVVADGIGTVAQALTLLEPPFPLSALVAGGPRAPGPVRRAAGVAVGLAQLATDGRPAVRLPASGTPRRHFVTVDLPLDEVREVARRHGARVSDVLLASVAGGLRRVMPGSVRTGRLRVAVPLMVREPGSSAEGNLTAAVMMDLPLGAASEPDRLAEVARGSRRLRTGTRALASRFVMRTGGALMPPPVHAWFARTVYGGLFFQGIVSNMPGPQRQLRLAGPPLHAVYPILPLAPGAPLAVGALGWYGTLHVALAVDPALVADPAALHAAVRAVFDELA